jgi:aspartyl-tRNA(Asn)/glutamyl-tRNA(Gln) amidotransferase subunit A
MLMTAAIEAAQKRIDAGEAPLLCGIPLAIKDNILIEGKIASAASKMLENYTAAYDATVIRKLKEAGALFLGARTWTSSPWVLDRALGLRPVQESA